MSWVWSKNKIYVIAVILLITGCGDSSSTESGSEKTQAYRIGIFEEPVALNYWNYLGPGTSVWTQ